MRATIQDPTALRAVSPAALVGYVIGEGWSRVEKFGNHSDIYYKDGCQEIILPGTAELGDYPAIVAETLRILAIEEGRDELQVYRDLVGAGRDVIRVRAPFADGDGSISLDDGVELVTQARGMLEAAACAAKDPRAAYRAGRVKDAASYMDRVRMGQTEHGSFVVTLLAPVPPNLGFEQGTLWPMEVEEPFERKVTRTLVKSLAAARSATENAVRGGGMSAFEAAIQSGVSANLCDALAKLITKGAGLEVSVTWAKTRPTPEKRRTVSFSEPEAIILEEAAREFRSMEPRIDERVEAFVVKLDRQPFDDQGRVSLKTFIDGQPVSIRASLNKDLYSLALQAHRNSYPISITGDLKRSGQRWILENPRHLLIRPEEADDEYWT